MASKLRRMSWSRIIIIMIGIVGVFIIVIVSTKYRSYAVAALWHSIHHNDVPIAGCTVNIPTFWWKEKAEDYDTYLIRRASPSNSLPDSQIIVRPALAGTTIQSDEEVRTGLQRLIAARQTKPVMGTSSYLVVLKTPTFVMYCERIDSKLLDVSLASHLSCEAAKLPHTFTYDGLPRYESEAESIISTLK